ncbi:hypothetical protein PMAYCL1PPCAC_31637, partial [Pristionchus mayeri]
YRLASFVYTPVVEPIREKNTKRMDAGCGPPQASSTPTTSTAEDAWPEVTAANGARPQAIYALASIRQTNPESSISPEAFAALKKALRSVRPGDDLLQSVINSVNRDAPGLVQACFTMVRGVLATLNAPALAPPQSQADHQATLLAQLQAQHLAFQQQQAAVEAAAAAEAQQKQQQAAAIAAAQQQQLQAATAAAAAHQQQAQQRAAALQAQHQQNQQLLQQEGFLQQLQQQQRMQLQQAQQQQQRVPVIQQQPPVTAAADAQRDATPNNHIIANFNSLSPAQQALVLRLHQEQQAKENLRQMQLAQQQQQQQQQ